MFISAFQKLRRILETIQNTKRGICIKHNAFSTKAHKMHPWWSLVFYFFRVVFSRGAIRTLRSSHQRCSVRKGVLIKKETLAQVFSCEFCKTSKNICFTEHLWATASSTLRSSQLVLKNFAKFTRKTLCKNPFIKKRDYGSGVFLWILRNF